MLDKLRKNQVLLCLTVVGAFFILAETIGISWFKAFIKSGDHRVYVLIYFSLMGVLTLLLFPYLKKKPIWACWLVGALVGYVAGFMSIFLLGVLQNGVSVWLESYGYYGASIFFAVFWGAIITGGWLIGAIMFYLLRSLYVPPE